MGFLNLSCQATDYEVNITCTQHTPRESLAGQSGKIHISVVLVHAFNHIKVNPQKPGAVQCHSSTLRENLHTTHTTHPNHQ